MKDLFELLDQHYEEMVEIRRYLHQNPELSHQEVHTPAYIAEYHKNLGHKVRTGVGERGVTAVLKGGKPGPTIALRADFDALPIHEATDVPFKSKVDGVMHACGHDGHTATLLVLAKVLNKLQNEIEGTVVFIHQHAEEYAPGGAIDMIADGCLEGVDAIFGVHLWATEPYGDLLYRSGPFMAAADRFTVLIKGKGGHGGIPHLTKDAIVTGSQLVVNLQQVVSRRVDPLESAVLSIGSFVSKNAFNVISDQAEIIGTVRTLNEHTRDQVELEMERIIKGTCLSAGCDYDFLYERGYPTVDNHERETLFIRDLGAKIPGIQTVREMAPIMGGEDFAYYLQHVPGSFFFIGAMDPDWDEAYPHHHPKFDIDERSMLLAAKTLGKAVLDYKA